MTGVSRRAVIGLVATIIAAAAVGSSLFVWSGVYNVAATVQHTAPVYALLTVATQHSIARRARTIAVPTTSPAIAIERGLPLYRVHCEQCHGAPGVAPQPFALGLTPLPANLALKARTGTPAELFWAIKFGLKMTGMPAWEFRLRDADIWALVAFLARLPAMTPEHYRVLANAALAITPQAALSAEAPIEHPDPARGKVALQQYACVTCHQIPGVVGATKPVGPPLQGIASRRYLAGILPNTQENLIAWLRSPSTIDPKTAMPDLYVSERDARDISAFLGALR